MPDVKIEVAAYKKNISDVASIRQPLVPPFTEKNDGNVLTAKNGRTLFDENSPSVNYVHFTDSETPTLYECDKTAAEIIEMANNGPVIGLYHDKEGFSRFYTMNCQSYDQIFGDFICFEYLHHDGVRLISDAFLVTTTGGCMRTVESYVIGLPAYSKADIGKSLTIDDEGNAIWKDLSSPSGT